MKKYMNIIVIPARNEGKRIVEVLEKTFANVKKTDRVIVVDNNSTDDTIQLIRKNFKNVDVLVERKIGKGNALRKGIAKAIEYTPEFVITMDGDGENDPLDIPRLVGQASNSDADMILGRRGKMRSCKRGALNTFERFWLELVTGYRIRDGSCGLRAIKGESLGKLRLKSEGFEIEMELILECRRNRMKVDECQVSVAKTMESGVKIRHIILINRFFDEWVIKWIYNGDCTLPLWKKIILFASCFAGLLIF